MHQSLIETYKRLFPDMEHETFEDHIIKLINNWRPIPGTFADTQINILKKLLVNFRQGKISWNRTLAGWFGTRFNARSINHRTRILSKIVNGVSVMDEKLKMIPIHLKKGGIPISALRYFDVTSVLSYILELNSLEIFKKTISYRSILSAPPG